MEVDFIIVGQGLSGTLLSYNLLKEGKTVLVIDADEESTSSKIAAGLYNPVTGRRMVKTWLADVLFDLLEPYYSELEVFLQTDFLYKKPIFRPFESIADQNYWYGQSADEAFKNYIKVVEENKEIEFHYHAPYGGFITTHSGYLKVDILLAAFRAYLIKGNCIKFEKFDFENLFSENGKVRYKDIIAGKIIFCQGIQSLLNPYFKYLPLEGTKGQILDVKIKGYNIRSIVNKGVFILPENDYQRVGSTYDRDYDHDLPTKEGRENLKGRLQNILKSEYEFINEKAAIRPTVVDRKPILGKHPIIDGFYVFNGLGTKGVSLAPFFSIQMMEYLVYGKPFLHEVDIRRFDYLYHENQLLPVDVPAA